MIGLVAGVPLLIPTPAPTPEKRDALDALCRALDLSDEQVREIRKLFDHFARRQATLAVEDVLEDAAADWEGGMRITHEIRYAPPPALDAPWARATLAALATPRARA